jgi:hypothetical protein
MPSPSPRALEALDASIPLLERIDAEFPAQANPGESLAAYRKRRLPVRIWTLLVALNGALLKKEVRQRPPGPTAKPRAAAAFTDQESPELPDKRLSEDVGATECKTLTSCRRSKSGGRRAQTAKARETQVEAAQARNAERRQHILDQYGGRGLAAGEVARRLTQEPYPAPKGGPWNTAQVLRLVGLDDLAKPAPAPAKLQLGAIRKVKPGGPIEADPADPRQIDIEDAIRKTKEP